MFRSIVVLVGGLASLSAVSCVAQEAVLGQEYGSGVHAYFAGDFVKAHQRLTSAIDGGTRDPRAYYFRGLSCLRLGRPQDAAIDFRKGAELESQDVNQFYNVGRALERVQGSARIELESYRVAARLAAYEAAEKLRKDRYEAIRREEARVLRAQAVAAPPEEEAVEVVEPPPAAEPHDPFAVPEKAAAAEESGTAEKKPAPKAPATPKKPAAEEEHDPFAEPAKPAEAKKPAETKPAAEEEHDPFAEPAKPAEAKPAAETEEDPFAEPAKPAEAKKPAAEANKGGLLGAMGKAVGGVIGKSSEKKPDSEKTPDAEKKPAEEITPAEEKEKAPAEEEDPFK